MREGNLRSRATKRKGIFDLSGKNMDEADTVYIGSEKSELRFRIYDKAKEQEDFVGIWNRLEMVCRRDYARAVIEAIVTSELDIGECVAGIIADKIAFIEQDDSNISRCSLRKWWIEFLETLKRIKIMLKEKPEQSIEKLANYFGCELAACVCVLSEVYGNEFWQNIKKRGKKQLRQRHYNLMYNHLAMQNANC